MVAELGAWESGEKLAIEAMPAGVAGEKLAIQDLPARKDSGNASVVAVADSVAGAPLAKRAKLGAILKAAVHS